MLTREMDFRVPPEIGRWGQEDRTEGVPEASRPGHQGSVWLLYSCGLDARKYLVTAHLCPAFPGIPMAE